ncbi:MAG: heterodisulfide reductase-related iron-sulfur binding cluster [Bacillota bacterium]
MEAPTVEVMRCLGVELIESDEQSCCGGFLTFTNVAEPTATMPVVARNLERPPSRWYPGWPPWSAWSGRPPISSL